MTVVLAVDGGNSKTDVALVTSAGDLLAAVRGPTSSHQAVGLAAGMASLAASVERAWAAAGRGGPADLGVFALAGADTTHEIRILERALAGSGLARTAIVRNDALAVLRAGSDRGWGVAVICGSGVGATGIGPDGSAARLAALGPISGDWGGGTDIGREGLAAAVRARDGRGPATLLAETVPGHFGLRTPAALTAALHAGRIRESRIGELSPVVFAAATAGDRVARSTVDRVADEVVAMAGAMLRRLHLLRRDPDVVLGGGVFRTADAHFHDRIRTGVEGLAPRARVIRLTTPPVAGAALLAIDALGAEAGAAGGRTASRLREALANWDRSIAG